MARLKLSKSALAQENQALARYRRFLPSLDMKRRQLMTERAKAVAAAADIANRIAELRACVDDQLSMLANHAIELKDLVILRRADIEQRNVVGVRLPVLRALDLEVPDYALLGRPHWVDALVVYLRQMIELRIEAQLAERRAALLDHAVQRITQRVNLFDKVLIPRTRRNIKTIKVYLSDNERAAVVRAKFAKAKHAARESAGQSQ